MRLGCGLRAFSEGGNRKSHFDLFIVPSLAGARNTSGVCFEFTDQYVEVYRLDEIHISPSKVSSSVPSVQLVLRRVLVTLSFDSKA